MINIQTDTRKIKKGDTFVAVKCEVNDGHQYIEKAIENGASKIVAERGEYSIPTLIVEDTREYIENYLEENYNKFLDEMTIIGITGTNGKTTSSYLIYQALNKLGVKTSYIGTLGFFMDEKVMNLPNTSVDICDTYDLLMKSYDAGYKVVVMEVSSHALSNNRLRTIKYDYAIFTNLTQDHLDHHKTMENYALAKQKLFKSLKKDGQAIVNIDDEYKDYYLLDENNNVTYGFNDSDYTISDVNMSNKGTTFKLNGLDIETKLIGRYNIYNLVDALVLLKLMGYNDDQIKDCSKDLNAPAGRMEKLEYKNNSIIIDYAHTPDGLQNFISTVAEFVEGNIYIVFGCTGDRDRTKRPIMTDIVGGYAKKFIITNDDPHFEDPNQIVSDMISNFDKDNYEVCLDRKEAIEKGIDLLKENDVLLILGKGHEEFMIVGRERIPFNDRKVVESYLQYKEENIC